MAIPGQRRRRALSKSMRVGCSVERAQVAEWLMAADCKSAAPCELRRFESSPVHQVFDEEIMDGGGLVGGAGSAGVDHHQRSEIQAGGGGSAGDVCPSHLDV